MTDERKSTGEKVVDLIAAFAEKILNDEKSIHAKCNNIYKEGDYGSDSECSCWRCGWKPKGAN